MRPARCASHNANGTDAEPVLPYSCRLTNTFSSGSASSRRTASTMRRFAWCGTSSATSSSVCPVLASTARPACAMRRTQARGSTIARWNVCTDTAMTAFATGLSQSYALRIRPNGEVLVANTSNVVRFDSGADSRDASRCTSIQPTPRP